MTKGGMREVTVQMAALQWLQKQYEMLPDTRRVIARAEQVVSKPKRYARKRADGLIVAQHHDGMILTVSMEAKSQRTAGQFRPKYPSLKKHAAIAVATVILIAAIAAYFLFSVWWKWILPFAVGILAWVLFTWLARGRYRTYAVVEQVLNYPGNERWIAVSTDMWNRLTKKHRAAFLATCRRKAIGCLRVSSRAHVVELLRPQFSPTRRGFDDYLECYAANSTIRASLTARLSENQSRSIRIP